LGKTTLHRYLKRCGITEYGLVRRKKRNTWFFFFSRTKRANGGGKPILLSMFKKLWINYQVFFFFFFFFFKKKTTIMSILTKPLIDWFLKVLYWYIPYQSNHILIIFLKSLYQVLKIKNIRYSHKNRLLVTRVRWMMLSDPFENVLSKFMVDNSSYMKNKWERFFMLESVTKIYIINRCHFIFSLLFFATKTREIQIHCLVSYKNVTLSCILVK
jgi:hypothetical protein